MNSSYLNILKNFILYALIFLINIFPIKINALSHNWVGVPRSKYGQQVWDKQSVKLNEDGSFRVFSKFIPKIKNDITQDILYTMDINCAEKTFRDVAVGAKDFNEFKNINAKWKYPNGDKLLLGVINQVCDFAN
tara:strand:- start:364 stop:765 length:402 start_codon:yes stop_codon:yes gene_type:complete